MFDFIERSFIPKTTEISNLRFGLDGCSFPGLFRISINVFLRAELASLCVRCITFVFTLIPNDWFGLKMWISVIEI